MLLNNVAMLWMHITVSMAQLVFVLCHAATVCSCIEPSLHGLDFFLEIFYKDFATRLGPE